MLTYDTGVLLAAERGDREVWSRHRAALVEGIRPTVPSVVLAQAWRGGPQPALSRLLKGCRIEPLDEPVARAAGAACAVSGTADVVDAAVVVCAARCGDDVLTSDPDDLQRIAHALEVGLVIHPV